MNSLDIERLEKSIKVKGKKFELLIEDKSKKYFDIVLSKSWKMLGEGQKLVDLQRRYNASLLVSNFSTSVNSQNRENDRERIRKEHNLREVGNKDTIFYDKKSGEIVGKGYQRVCYGDHGPYIEFSQNQVNWDAFRFHKVKGPDRHYHEHYTKEKNVKLYNQFQGVEDEPNPPPGIYSFNNERKEGYADYMLGCCYVSPDDLCVVKPKETTELM